MADPRFYRAAGPFTVAEIALLTEAEIGGAGAADLSLEDVAPLEAAGPRHLTFLSHPRYVESFAGSAAGAAFVHPDLAAKAPPSMTLLVSANPYRSFAMASQAFHPPAAMTDGIARSAVVDPTAIIAADVMIAPNAVIEAGAEIGIGSSIGPCCVIGRGVVVGRACRIGANVTVSHCLMGDRVILHPGVRIGQDGFGFAQDPAGHVKIAQLGRVLIGDDVEIGANTTVDRGAGPDTIIGSGCMIDNLVQIGHNVVLGRGCVLVAQTGISGSTKLADFVTTAGQSGLAGHLSIGRGARIAAKSGVMRDVPPDGVVAGIPAVPVMQWHRQTAMLNRLSKKKGS